MLKSIPIFWFRQSPLSYIISTIMLPASFLFLILSYLRRLFSCTHRIHNKTIICVGNVIVGGAGKTPIAISLCNEFKKTSTVCFISKGYKRKSKGFIKVDNEMNSTLTGDEPQLLQKHAQVYLYTKVRDIINNLSQIPEKIIIMDDGLQNSSIYKDCTILVLDDRMLGNGKILPAGPLRETMQSAMRKTDFIISNNKIPTKKVYHTMHTTFSDLLPQEVVAFSGIGNNSKFIKSLYEKGFTVVKFFPFPDHHSYSKKDLAKIQGYANKTRNLPIITTEKDYVKLPNHFVDCVHILNLSVKLEENLITDIKEKLKI